MSKLLHQGEINRAREYYNPLRGLDVPRLVRLLEQGERGQHADLQKLYRVMEKRYYVLLALKGRRLGALKKLDWSVKVSEELPRGLTQAQAEAQADLLRSAYNQIENLPQAVEHLALASFRGYAHLEKHYVGGKPALGINRLEPVPQEHFSHDQQSWAWKYDPEARDQVTGSTAIDLGDFIVREVPDPLNEIAVLCGLRANMSKKDWDAFCEDYNLPSVFFSLGENTPVEKVKEWLEVAEKVTGNSRGALPPGGVVTPLDLAGDGIQFEKHMLWQEREVVLAGTGGLLTMIAESGSGTLAGSAHQDAFDLLALAEAMEVSAIFQAQFDKPLLAQEFPSQPIAAYFELAAEDTEDLDKLAERLVKLKGAGFEADVEEISEKFGLKLSKAAAAVAPGFAPGRAGKLGDPSDQSAPTGPTDPKEQPKAEVIAFANRTAEFANRAAESATAAAVLKARSVVQVVSAQDKAFEPVLRRLAQIEAITDPVAQLAALERVKAAFPEIARQVLARTDAEATARAEAMAAAAVSGLAESAQAKAAKETKTPKTAPSVRPAPSETRLGRS